MYAWPSFMHFIIWPQSNNLQFNSNISSLTDILCAAIFFGSSLHLHIFLGSVKVFGMSIRYLMEDVYDEHTRNINDGIEMATSHPVAQSQQCQSSSSFSPEANNQLPSSPADVVIQISAEDIKTTNENCCGFIRAVLAGDKEEAVRIFSLSTEEVVQIPIGWNGETAFHMAVLAAKEKHVAVVVKKILSLNNMTIRDILAIATKFGSNALHFAAVSGNLDIVKKIHVMNTDLANMINRENAKPIYLAALAGHSGVIKFLLHHTTFDIQDGNGSSVLNICISSGLFGLAVDLVERHNLSAVTRDEYGVTALEVLARMSSTDVGEECLTKAFWRKVRRTKERSRNSIKQLLEKIWPILKNSPELHETSYLQKLILTAAEKGNHEFIVHLLRHYPGLVYSTNGSRHTIFQIGIFHRHEEIFTLIHEIGSLKDFLATYIDDDGNSMLHLAAKLSPPDQLNRIHGAALQMQRELLWYKEVEKIVPPAYVKLENKKEKSPHDIFVDEHLELMNAGEKWMKRTTQFSMVVSTLIATVVFTAAFTIPGGINNNGSPNFRSTNYFDMFVISEIIAMLFSSISIVMYLCILTSRYTKKDFLKALPLCLTIGTTSLFVSLIAMLVAFCSAFLVFERHGIHYVHKLLGFLAVAPAMFACFKYPLLADIMKTTTSSKSLSRSSRKLFPKKH